MSRLLRGEEQAIRDPRAQLRSWYEQMVGRLLFSNPLIKVFDLEPEIEVWGEGDGT